MRKIKVVSQMFDNIYRPKNDYSDTSQLSKQTNNQIELFNHSINTLEDFHTKPFKQHFHTRSQTLIEHQKPTEGNKDLDFVITQDQEANQRFTQS